MLNCFPLSYATYTDKQKQLKITLGTPQTCHKESYNTRWYIRLNFAIFYTNTQDSYTAVSREPLGAYQHAPKIHWLSKKKYSALIHLWDRELS